MPTYGDWQTDKTITVYQHSWECLPETRARQCRRCGRLWTYHTPGPPLHGCTGPLEEAARKIIEQSDRMMDQMTAEALMDESKRVFGTGAQRDTA